MNDLRIPGVGMSTPATRVDTETSISPGSQPDPNNSFGRALDRANANREQARANGNAAPASRDNRQPARNDSERAEQPNQASANAQAQTAPSKPSVAKKSDADSDTQDQEEVDEMSAQSADILAALAAAALASNPAAAADAKGGALKTAAGAEAEIDPAATAKSAPSDAHSQQVKTLPENARREAAAITESAEDARLKRAPRSDLSTGDLKELSAAEAPAQAVRDRLLEDFERRYERALAVAVGGPTQKSEGTVNLAAALSSAPSMAPTPTYSIAHAGIGAAVNTAAFGEELSHRVLLFTSQRVQNAEIAVTPADLGPINVSIEVRGQEASLAFSAAHATTRTAIEDALPRLREMLAAQGLQLTQAQVGDQSQRNPNRSGGGRQNNEQRAALDGLGGTATSALSGVSGGVGSGGTGITTINPRLIDIHV